MSETSADERARLRLTARQRLTTWGHISRALDEKETFDMRPEWAAQIEELTKERDESRLALLAERARAERLEAELFAARTRFGDALAEPAPAPGGQDAERDRDAARWKLLTRVASLGFDDAPLWKAVIRLPVFDNGDQTITALVDRIAIAERAADKGA